jgi:hypothetical protein
VESVQVRMRMENAVWVAVTVGVDEICRLNRFSIIFEDRMPAA